MDFVCLFEVSRFVSNKPNPMPTFEVKTNQTINLGGEYIDKGLSVQISTMFSNPFDDIEKIHKAFIRVHGIDFKKEGYLSLGYFGYEKV